MWQKNFKDIITSLGRIIAVLIFFAVLFPILFSTLMRFGVTESLAKLFESPKSTGGWSLTIRLFMTDTIPFLICVALALGLVLKFLGGDFRTAIFAGASVGLLYFVLVFKAVTKSVDAFVKMGILSLLYIPFAALIGALAYFIVSKLNFKALKKQRFVR